MHHSNVRGNILLAVLLWVFTYIALDASTTIWLMANASAGISGEQNPLTLAILVHSGTGGMIAAKAGISLILGVLFIVADGRCEKHVQTTFNYTLSVLTGLTFLIVFNNLLVMAAINFNTSSLASPSLLLVATLIAALVVYTSTKMLQLPKRSINVAGTRSLEDA